jgi:hypothetical protein
MVIYRPYEKEVDTLLDNSSETHNTNIAVASAITAYARIHMTQFKNNPDYNLYYSDTDSAYFDTPLPDKFVSAKVLRKMKLESICNEAIFLSPKVYCLLTNEDKLIYKVKGLKHNIELTLKDFDSLLHKDTFIEKYQTK